MQKKKVRNWKSIGSTIAVILAFGIVIRAPKNVVTSEGKVPGVSGMLLYSIPWLSALPTLMSI